jgi:dipeptidyl aminopeptidase/acylaminoacyl peptidase
MPTPNRSRDRRKPIDADTLWKLARVGAVALSPDARTAVCAVTSCSMDDNQARTHLWLLPTDTRAPRKLTSAGDKDGSPAWSPTGDRIAFIAKREQGGRKDSEPQLYVIAAAGGEAERKSDFGPGVVAFKWMPDGRRIAFVSWVWPDAKGSRAQTKRHKAFTERKESAYVTSEALYRHWDTNLPMDRVPRLLMLELASGRVTDLFEGTDYELPRVEPGASHFDISPDGRRIAFVHDPSPGKRADHMLALAELDLATRRITPLTGDAAWSYEAPRYSPDGSVLACLAAHLGKRHTMPNRLALRSGAGPWRIVGSDWEVDVEGPLRWSTDGCAIFFAAQERGRRHLWRHEIGHPGRRTLRHPGRPDSVDGPGSDLSIALPGGWVQSFDLAHDGKADRIVVAIDSASHPVQVHAVDGAGARRLERFNDAILPRLALGETREVSFKGALGDPVQMFLTFPPRFDASRRHPLLQVIHGGPYAAAGDTFSWRWNTHLLASRGHVVASVNYHGSSGFGHRFHDSIMGRLGQLELRDIEAGTDWLLAQPWAEAGRVYAAGASYGGFLVAWMNGHVPPGRYRAYVCHAGVFDRVATFSADSYIQRPRDLGALFWRDPQKVRSQSPCTFAHRMHTPTLVTHGARDYRVPDTNGLAYYNTLLARGVPTRLVWFPDENHWVLKPRNSRLWYGEVFDWLEAHDAG